MRRDRTVIDQVSGRRRDHCFACGQTGHDRDPPLSTFAGADKAEVGAMRLVHDKDAEQTGATRERGRRHCERRETAKGQAQLSIGAIRRRGVALKTKLDQMGASLLGSAAATTRVRTAGSVLPSITTSV